MIRHYLSLISLALLIFFTDVSQSIAQTTVDYEEKIKKCTDDHRKDLDSGVTASMRRGGHNVLLCLQSIVGEDIWPQFAPERISQEKSIIDAGMKQISFDYQSAVERCSPACGTIMPLLLISEEIHLYESYIRSFYLQRLISEVWDYSPDFGLE